MNGRVTLVGCPKLDGVNYAEKLDNGNLDNEVAMITKGDKIYSTADSSASVVGTIEEDTKITEAYKYILLF